MYVYEHIFISLMAAEVCETRRICYWRPDRWPFGGRTPFDSKRSCNSALDACNSKQQISSIESLRMVHESAHRGSQASSCLGSSMAWWLEINLLYHFHQRAFQLHQIRLIGFPRWEYGARSWTVERLWCGISCSDSKQIFFVGKVFSMFFPLATSYSGDPSPQR